MKNKQSISILLISLSFSVAVMLIMTLCMWYTAKIAAFIVCAILTALAIALSIYSIVTIRSQGYRLIKNSYSILTAAEKSNLDNIPVALLTVDKSGMIMWYNDLMREQVFNNKDYLGCPLGKFIENPDLEQMSEKICEFETNDKVFGVYTAKIYLHKNSTREYAYSLYFIDQTVLKKTYREYHSSRPAVAYIVVDNMDELLQNSKQSGRAQLSVQLETILEKWMNSTTGFFKKFSDDRFIAVFEERHLAQIIDGKFGVLDEVRKIVVGEHTNATLSIGVGRGGKTLIECDNMARQALDMALGRGGDQAAVRTGSGYEFFGGVSKGIEKQSRVRTRSIARALTQLISRSDNVLIMGHKASDLDCLGASVGLWREMRTLGKPCSIVIDKPTSLAKPLINKIEEYGLGDILISPEMALEIITKKTVLIIVDTHNPKIIESYDVYKNCKTVVVIDHHRKMVDHIDNAMIFYHEPIASSASEMVAELLQYMDDSTIGMLEAQALLAGIMLDTKSFTQRTGVRTFEAAAYLRKKGADTIEVNRLFSSSFDNYQLKAQLIACAKAYGNSAISCSASAGKNMRICAAQAADELLSIKNIDASYVLYLDGDTVYISARSLGKVNVQLVMEEIGGGGHQTMAGAQLKCSLNDAYDSLIAAIDKYSGNKNQQNDSEN